MESLGAYIRTDYPHQGGSGLEENWPLLLEKYNIKTKKSVSMLTERTIDAFFDHLGEIEVKKGFFELSRELLINDVKRVLATSSTKEVVTRMITALNLQNEFDEMVTGSEVHQKKPDPEIFIKACAKVKVEPEEALVIEDSEAGFKAA